MFHVKADNVAVISMAKIIKIVELELNLWISFKRP